MLTFRRSETGARAKAGLQILVLFMLLVFRGDANEISSSYHAYYDIPKSNKTLINELLQYIKDSENAINNLKNSGLHEINIQDADPVQVAAYKHLILDICQRLNAIQPFIKKSMSEIAFSFSKADGSIDTAILISCAAELAHYNIMLQLADITENNKYLETITNYAFLECNPDFRYDAEIVQLGNLTRLLRIYLSMIYIERIHKECLEANASIMHLLDYTLRAHQLFFGDIYKSIDFAAGGLSSYLFNTIAAGAYPLVAIISDFASNKRLASRMGYYIDPQQIQELYQLLEPGDILLQKRESYLSNIGIPGFFTHSVLYTGSFEKLDQYFSKESYVKWGSTFSEYVLNQYPDLYWDKIEISPEGYFYSTIEAKAEGVIILPLEISGHADHMAGLRPMLSKSDKMLAIISAFRNYGKAYDFNFNFASEHLLGCSELIYKAYLLTHEKQGLTFRLREIAGRWMFMPNDFACDFSLNHNTSNQQLEFVFFLQGDKTSETASFKSEEYLVKNCEP